MPWEDANRAAAPLAQPRRNSRRNSVHKCPKMAPRGHFRRSVYTPASSRLPTTAQQCTQMAQNGSEMPSQPICVHSCVPRSHIMYGFLPEQASHGCSPRCGTGQLVSLEDCLAGGEEITRMKGLCVWGCPGIAQVLFLYRWKFLLWSRALDSPRFCVWGEASWRQGCVNS